MSRELSSPTERTDAVLLDLRGLDHWPSEQARSWVLEFADRECSSPRTVALVLIGSLARGLRSSVDLDLLHLYQDGRPSYRGHPIDVDIRSIAASDVDALLRSGHDLLSWSLRFGRLICERDSFWTSLVENRLPELPLPSADLAEERARKTERVYGNLLEVGDTEAAHEQLLSLLTHRAWAVLLRSGEHPASRPELPGQLRCIGESSLAEQLEASLKRRRREQTELVS